MYTTKYFYLQNKTTSKKFSIFWNFTRKEGQLYSVMDHHLVYKNWKKEKQHNVGFHQRLSPPLFSCIAKWFYFLENKFPLNIREQDNEAIMFPTLRRLFKVKLSNKKGNLRIESKCLKMMGENSVHMGLTCLDGKLLR